ncbi:MAG: SsrA-binding protein SmpB [Alphaproteobacteria bacterium]
MASKKKDKKSGLLSTNVTVAENRRARYEYTLEDKFEAGMMLTGSEVKSLRTGQCSINEAYVGPRNSELWLFNANIAEYKQAHADRQHEPKRMRKLLLNKREMNKLLGSVTRDGYTIVPLRLFFNGRGLAKLEIALGKGKKLHDKRETEKKRDWSRQKSKLLRTKD